MIEILGNCLMGSKGRRADFYSIYGKIEAHEHTPKYNR